MYDCEYAESETIKVAGKKFVVTSPLDPSTYFKLDASGNMIEGRYMVFSESERKYYGLEEYDLTAVEKKIIDMQKNVYKSSLKLLDYYVLSDETLINAYAMNQLFEFNKEFSQIGIMKQYVLYPQAYELKAFSYDAYLRMILSGATGEMIQTETGESIYTRIMHNTSWFFGIFLLLNDLLAVYLIPGLRLFIIVAVFLLSIIMITGACIRLEFNFAKTLWSSLLKPLASYLAVTVGMSYLVSLFMYDNTSGVTGDNTYISLGDPTMTMIIMVILNAIVVVLYFKICMGITKSIKSLAGALFSTVKGTVLGAGGAITGALTVGAIGALGLRAAGAGGARAVGSVGRAGANGMGRAAGRLGKHGAGGANGGLGLPSPSTLNRPDTGSNGLSSSTPTTNKYDSKVDSGAQARVTKNLNQNSSGTYTDNKGKVVASGEAKRRLAQSRQDRENFKTGKNADREQGAGKSRASKARQARKAAQTQNPTNEAKKKNLVLPKESRAVPKEPTRAIVSSKKKDRKAVRQKRKAINVPKPKVRAQKIRK